MRERTMIDPTPTWINDGNHDLDVAQFVLEDADFVNHIVSRAVDELCRLTEDRHRSFASAVHTARPDSLRAVVASLYLHLKQDHRLRYEYERAFLEATGAQRVRLPGTIRQENRGTCLDLALLFASCLANAKLWPIVVVVHGHALTACWTATPDPARETFITLDELRGRLDSGEIVAVECTGFVEGFPERPYRVSYAEACQKGRELLQGLEPGLFRFALDVQRAWQKGVRPFRVPAAAAWPPRPNYPDEFVRELSERDKELRRRLREMRVRGASPEEIQAVERQRRELKRQLRDGPRLKAGDCLSDRYLLLAELGSGGFATAWRAYDEERHQEVALKVLHGQHLGSAERIERFKRGARAMQQLTHPNVVRILDPYREDGGHHYFVMEYVTGGTFLAAVTSGGLTVEKRIGVVLAVGNALAAAHGQGIIHRDVTPDNILLDGAGSARLTDFDLVRLEDSTGGTRTGALGKYLYAAPECMESARDADQRCDVYSLGMTAVFALSGKKLPPAALRRWEHFLEGLECSGAVKVVLRQATAHELRERFGTVKEFCAALVAAFDFARLEPLPLPPHLPSLVNSVGMKFVLIPAGRFLMGSPEDEEGRDDDEQQHEVEITKPFYLGVHPVTQAQWREVMGSNPNWFCATGGGNDEVRGQNTDDFPVEQVSWEDAQTFLKTLAELQEEVKEGRKYRLPSEAEWEYACRGGATSYSTFHFGNSLSSTQANFNGNYPYGGAAKGPYLERTSKVGSYSPNAFGLYDLHGNVWEWCSEWYDPEYYMTLSGTLEWFTSEGCDWAGPDCYKHGPMRDPGGPSQGSNRVLRGGSWNGDGRDCRSAARNWNAPAFRGGNVGFRVALVLPAGQDG
jgi:formylglycine-generating enzyme required for sulfatase activity/tRNA A-37 threonylcarbamoyl transferase component Bud32